MILERTDYRSILNEIFEARCSKNPKYSLRAFARDLEISSSRLSQVLRGNYGISKRAALAITEKLDFSEIEKNYFCDMVEAAHGRDKKKKEISQKRIQELQVANQNFATLHLDYFATISDVIHFTILELTYVDGFQSNIEWISKQLGVQKFRVEQAIQRLVRLELLDTSGKVWKDTQASLATTTDTPSQALKDFYIQLWAKAQRALVERSVQERDMSSITFAFDSNQLPKAKEHIKNFRRQMDSFSKESDKKDSVYCLSIQFFNLLEKQV